MLGLDYIRWEDYLRDEYLPKYNLVKKYVEDSSNMNFETMFKECKALYNAACNLMKYFLWNQGLFYSNAKRVLRRIYKFGYIENGDNWMELISMILAEEGENDSSKAAEYIINNFYLFDNFKKQMERLTEKDA